MSYISILVPAFHFNTLDTSEIISLCSIQFETPLENFDLIEFKDKSSSNKNFALKFNESFLSLNSIEDLIYQRDCIKSLNEKIFESLKLMTQKLSDLENQIKSFNENGNNNEDIRKDLVNDNIKLRDLLASQIEYSDNFRMNTEKTLNKIKEEFQTMVKELETMRKKTGKNKSTSLRENLNNNNIINGNNNILNGNNNVNGNNNKKNKNNINNNNKNVNNNNNNNNYGNGVPKLNFNNNNK